MNTSPAVSARRINQTAILAIILANYFMIVLDATIIFTGLAVFTVASFLVGTAPTEWLLVAARALQGAGAAIVAPSALSLLTASFPAGRERTRAVSYYDAVAGTGASLGLVVGGAMAEWVSWRAGFFINVPLGIALMAAGLRYIPESPRSTGRFDLAGAVSSTLGMGSLVFGIVNAADAGWTSPATVAALVAAATLLVINEKRVKQPTMPLHLFASPFQAGLAFFPMTVVNLFVALLVLVNTAHQLGSSRGVGVLVTVSAGAASLTESAATAHSGGTYMLAAALLFVLILIVPPEVSARRAARVHRAAVPAEPAMK